MGRAVLIVGKSGAGKSRSLKNLNPDTSFLINVADKELPYRSQFVKKNKEGKIGNTISTSNPDTILKTLTDLPQARENVLDLVVDDFQYFMSFLYIDRIGEKNYFEKFNDILRYTKWMYDAIRESRDDLIVYLMCHSEELDEFNKKAKTAGKAVDKYLTLEGLFTIVLWADMMHEPGDPPTNEYFFETQGDGTNTAKTPEEMFDFRIPNDLSFVSKRIREYYGT